MGVSLRAVFGPLIFWSLCSAIIVLLPSRYGFPVAICTDNDNIYAIHMSLTKDYVRDYRGHIPLKLQTRGFLELSSVFVLISGIIVLMVAMYHSFHKNKKNIIGILFKQVGLLIFALNVNSVVFAFLSVYSSEGGCKVSTAFLCKGIDTCVWFAICLFSIGKWTKKGELSLRTKNEEEKESESLIY